MSERLERSSFLHSARLNSQGPHNQSSQAIYLISGMDLLEFQLVKIPLFLMTYTYALVSLGSTRQVRVLFCTRSIKESEFDGAGQAMNNQQEDH